MTGASRAARAVLEAELKIEWRNPSGWFCASLFSLLVLLTQALAFPAPLAGRPDVAFAAFFVSAFFAALLSEQSRAARERKTGSMYLLALSPAPDHGLYFGKAAASFGLICLIELILAPFLILFYNLPVRPAWLGVAFLCVLANLALAGLTTLLGAATSAWRGIGSVLALPILILPIAMPILATVAIGSSLALTGREFLSYFKLLLAAALAIGTVGALTYGKLLGKN